jgi:hypothetical protein
LRRALDRFSGFPPAAEKEEYAHTDPSDGQNDEHYNDGNDFGAQASFAIPSASGIVVIWPVRDVVIIDIQFTMLSE